MGKLRSPEISRQIGIYVNNSRVGINSHTANETFESVKDSNTSTYSISNNKVVWNDGTILQYNGADVLPTDTIVDDRQYTTRANVSTIKAGTYVFKQTITNPTSNINVAYFTEVKGYYLTANNTYVSAPEDITDWTLTPNGCTFSPGGKANNMNNWTTTFYDFSSGSLVTYTANDTKLLRTIIVTADQTNIREAFYNWFMSNIETTPTSGETWLLNETLTGFDQGLVSFEYNVNFTSNGNNYSILKTGKSTDYISDTLIYDTVIVYNRTGLNTWKNEAYRTITFATSPTGNLLTWLQANGTKQGSTPTYKFKHWKKSNVKVNEQSTETWLFNSPMSDMMTNKEINITFTSNGETFTQLAIRLNKGIMNYVKSDRTSVGAYEDGWVGNPQYQTITVDTRQTNYQELRTFLNSTASIQSSNKYFFKPYTILGLYTITTTLTNCTGASANATKIQENGGLTLTFTANSGYELPTGVSVTNVTSYNWNKTTGVLAISKPTGDVAIEIVAVSALPQLSTPTNVAVSDTTLTFDEVANATSYEVFVDNVSIGTYVAKVTHTLTFESDITTKVNGTNVTSPYTFNEGDTILLTTPSAMKVNGTTYASDTTLTLSGEDINVTTTGMPLTENITITINTSGGVI